MDSKVYIEYRDRLSQFVILHLGQIYGYYHTQAAAINAAKLMFPSHSPEIERQRHTSAGKPDQWR